MSYIYISHCEGDVSAPLQIKQFLKFSFETWCPADDIPCGIDAGEVIPGKIRDACALLLLLSEKSGESRQLSRELHLADKYSIPVIAVSKGKISLSEKLEYYLSDVSLRDVTGFENDLSVLNGLSAELKKYAEKKDCDKNMEEHIAHLIDDAPIPREEVASDQPSALSERLAVFDRKRAESVLAVLPCEETTRETDYVAIAEAEEIIARSFGESGVTSEMSLVTGGPAFTRYIFNVDKPISGEILASVRTSIDNELSLSTDVYAAEEGEGVVIDIPLAEKETIHLSDFLKEETYLSSPSFVIPAGKDVNENCIFADLGKAKKLLVTGGTDGERDMFVKTAVLSLAAKFPREELNIVVADGNGSLEEIKELPNTVGFIGNKTNSVAERCKALSVLDWAAMEADKRKQLFILASDEGKEISDLAAYNAAADKEEFLPYVVVVASGLNESYKDMIPLVKAKLERLSSLAPYGIYVIISACFDLVDAHSYDCKAVFRREGCACHAGRLSGDGDLIYKTPAYQVRVQQITLSAEEIASVLAALPYEERKMDASIAPIVKKAALKNFKAYEEYKATLEDELEIVEEEPIVKETVEEAPKVIEEEPIIIESAEESSETIEEEPVVEATVEELSEVIEKDSIIEEAIEGVPEAIEEEPVVEENAKEIPENVEEESIETAEPSAEEEFEIEIVIETEDEESEVLDLTEETTEESPESAEEEPAAEETVEELPEVIEEEPVAEEAVEELPEVIEEQSAVEETVEKLPEVIEEESIVEETAEELPEAIEEDPAVEETAEEVPEAIEEEPIVEETVEEVPEVVEEEPVVEETAEELPEVVEEEPVVEETVEELPEAIEEEPVVEETAEEVPKSVEEEPVVEETAEEIPEAIEEEPIVEETAEEVPEVVEEEPVVEETAEEIPEAVEEEPAVEETVEEVSEAIEEEPVVEENVEEIPETIEEEPIVEETAEEVPEAIEEEPVVEENVEKIPEVIEEAPAVEETVEEVPEVIEEEPIVEETVEEIPEVVEEEPAVEEEEARWTYVPEDERPAQLYLDALKLFVDKKRVSISLLQQRPLMLNYTKAFNIIKWMTEKGYVSSPDPLGNRILLITEEDYETMYGSRR